MHAYLEIAKKFEKYLEHQDVFNKKPRGLYQPCQYLLQAGGKRIRPALCLMGHELFSELDDAAFQAAMALELFHNFTLIHDDIMDDAPLRRGKKTVHEQFGLTAGILSGDVMNIYAYQQLEQLPSYKLTKILPAFNKMAIEVCEGQQLDFDFETKEQVREEEYLKMITCKTSVLIALSLKIGGITGGCSDEEAQLLSDFGRYLGIAFQLQDDYLDVFGQHDKTGKQPGGDVLAKKKTILYIYYKSRANKTEQQNLKDLYHGDAGGKVRKITQLFLSAGVDKAVAKKVEDYTNKAFDRLDQLQLPKSKTLPLSNLFRLLLHRLA